MAALEFRLDFSSASVLWNRWRSRIARRCVRRAQIRRAQRRDFECHHRHGRWLRGGRYGRRGRSGRRYRFNLRTANSAHQNEKRCETHGILPVTVLQGHKLPIAPPVPGFDVSHVILNRIARPLRLRGFRTISLVLRDAAAAVSGLVNELLREADPRGEPLLLAQVQMPQ